MCAGTPPPEKFAAVKREPSKIWPIAVAVLRAVVIVGCVAAITTLVSMRFTY